MSQGYSMKHIGITIAVSLIVVVLISPLLRPAGESRPGVVESSSAERAAVTAYRETMVELCRGARLKFQSGAVPKSVVVYAQLEADLAQLKFLALDAPGREIGAARAAVKAHYFGELRKLLQSPGGGGEDTQLIRVTRDECLARIELAGKLTELSDNQEFEKAMAEWELDPGQEKLKRMFEAEFK